MQLRFKYSELLWFWILPIIQYSKNKKEQCFGNWICVCPRVRLETPILLGPLERGNRSRWATRICISTEGDIPVFMYTYRRFC
jgi:hypothetical protein